jgi:hypothetical protein
MSVEAPKIRHGPQRALLLPEIMLTIFEYLSCDMASLSQAARVNSAWSPLAISVMWRKLTDVALFRVSNHTRRQLYANHIRYLSVWDDCPVGSLEGTGFPRLKSLTIGPAGSLARCKPYLQPRLTDVAVIGSPSLELAVALAELCPRLQRVLCALQSMLYGQSVERDIEAAHHFLRCCPLSVSSVGFWDRLPDCAATIALFKHLAQRPRLAVLELLGSIGGAGLQAALDMPATGAIFADLRQLRIRLASRHVHMIPRVAPALKQLRLSIIDSDVRALPALAPLTQLTDLVVHYFNKATPPLDSETTALGRLHSLRALSVKASSQPLLLTDNGLASTLRSLPRLKRLRLAFYGGIPNLSGAAICAVGEQCRDLERLEMSGDWDLSSWRHSRFKPLFPRLSRLWLEGASLAAEASAAVK